eukprot:5624060-Pleurochrysis_carterae.AAC.1
MRARSEAVAARFARFLSSLTLRVFCFAKPGCCCALLQHGHLEAVLRPLAQQLPLLLAVGALAHPSRGAIGVPKDDTRTHIVAACPRADVVRAPESKEALRARGRHRHAAQTLAIIGGD